MRHQRRPINVNVPGFSGRYLLRESSPYSLASGLGAVVYAPSPIPAVKTVVASVAAPKAIVAAPPVKVAPPVVGAAKGEPLKMTQYLTEMQDTLIKTTAASYDLNQSYYPDQASDNAVQDKRARLLWGAEHTSVADAALQQVIQRYPLEYAAQKAKTDAQKSYSWIPLAVIGTILTAGAAASYLLPAAGAAGATTAAGEVAAITATEVGTATGMTSAAVVTGEVAAVAAPVAASTAAVAAPSVWTAAALLGGAKTAIAASSLALTGYKMLAGQQGVNSPAAQAALPNAYASYAQQATAAGYTPVPQSAFAAWAASGGEGQVPVGAPLAAGPGLDSSWLPLIAIGIVGAILITRR